MRAVGMETVAGAVLSAGRAGELHAVSSIHTQVQGAEINRRMMIK